MSKEKEKEKPSRVQILSDLFLVASKDFAEISSLLRKLEDSNTPFSNISKPTVLGKRKRSKSVKKRHWTNKDLDHIEEFIRKHIKNGGTAADIDCSTLASELNRELKEIHHQVDLYRKASTYDDLRDLPFITRDGTTFSQLSTQSHNRIESNKNDTNGVSSKNTNNKNTNAKNKGKEKEKEKEEMEVEKEQPRKKQKVTNSPATTQPTKPKTPVSNIKTNTPKKGTEKKDDNITITPIKAVNKTSVIEAKKTTKNVKEKSANEDAKKEAAKKTEPEPKKAEPEPKKTPNKPAQKNTKSENTKTESEPPSPSKKASIKKAATLPTLRAEKENETETTPVKKNVKKTTATTPKNDESAGKDKITKSNKGENKTDDKKAAPKKTTATPDKKTTATPDSKKSTTKTPKKSEGNEEGDFKTTPIVKKGPIKSVLANVKEEAAKPKKQGIKIL